MLKNTWFTMAHTDTEDPMGEGTKVREVFQENKSELQKQAWSRSQPANCIVQQKLLKEGYKKELQKRKLKKIPTLA